MLRTPIPRLAFRALPCGPGQRRGAECAAEPPTEGDAGPECAEAGGSYAASGLTCIIEDKNALISSSPNRMIREHSRRSVVAERGWCVSIA